MTPAEHQTEAETLLTAAETPSSSNFAVGPSDADFDVIQAHAALARAAGTGTHYADAETALATAATAKPNGNLRATYRIAARQALAHALLADL